MKARLEEVKREILDDQNVIQNLDWLRTNLEDFGLDKEAREKFETAIDDLAEQYHRSKRTGFFTTLLNSTFRDLALVLDDKQD
jgi:hypothetical protein